MGLTRRAWSDNRNFHNLAPLIKRWSQVTWEVECERAMVTGSGAFSLSTCTKCIRLQELTDPRSVRLPDQINQVSPAKSTSSAPVPLWPPLNVVSKHVYKQAQALLPRNLCATNGRVLTSHLLTLVLTELRGCCGEQGQTFALAYNEEQIQRDDLAKKRKYFFNIILPSTSMFKMTVHHVTS
jgi:hypothetical protein